MAAPRPARAQRGPALRTPLQDRLTSPWLTIRAQIVLAGIFILAGALKIADPPGFAHEIHNYALVPERLVSPMALILPWLEVVAGLALFLGVWRRAAAGIFAVLLVVFIVALSIDLVRGKPVDCGCFGTSSVPKTEAQRLTEMKVAIGRDVLLLLLAGQILWAVPRPSRRLPPR